MSPPYPLLVPGVRFPAAAGRCALAVMIKAPRPGASKTRLTPPLSPEQAAALSRCFLRDTAENIAGVIRAGAPALGVAVYTPVGMESAFDGLLPGGFGLLAQREEDFGGRLHGAAADLFSVGFASVCLIDSDSPTLPPACLAAAVARLAAPGERVVLGPSADGGYYLVGLGRPHRRLFEQIDWSTARVAAQTRAAAAAVGLPCEELPVWYDVDTVAELGELRAELFAGARAGQEGHPAAHTRNFLEALRAAEPAGPPTAIPTPPAP